VLTMTTPNPSRSTRQSGLTLIELLITLSLFLIIVNMALPSFYELKDKYQSQTAVNRTTKMLNNARLLALNTHEPVTLCPLVDGQCSDDWNGLLAIFSDLNQNQALEDGESLHQVSDPLSNRGKWFTRKNVETGLTFSPFGHAYGQASTLLYCPESKIEQYARRIIINLQGRIRVANYLSRNGTPYSDLGNMLCPK